MNVEVPRLRGMALRAAMLLLCLVIAGAGGAASDIDARFTVHDLTREHARALASASPSARVPARTAATWCGTPTQADLAPNAVAGSPVHWVYAIPSDGPDRFGSYGSLMQGDAESIDAWWRGQDPLRTPRNDLAPFSCGSQLDLTLFRLTQSSSQLASVDARFTAITSSLMMRGFGSRHTKYLVYYDGPVEPDICGQGGSSSSGLGFAVVYVQACPGVPWNTTAAHELLHALGAVSNGAPNNCPDPDDGHVCDNPYDMMYPFGDETPITGLALDSGRDDYYGHSGAWFDTQDSPWLVQLDRQVPFALTVSGSGSVTADVPGLRCSQTCTTTWSAGTALELSATPASRNKTRRLGLELLGTVDLQGGRGDREVGIGGVRPRDLPVDRRCQRPRLGSKLAPRHRLPATVLGARSLPRGGSPVTGSLEGVALQAVERRVSWQGNLLRTDDERDECPRRLRPPLDGRRLAERVDVAMT